MSSEEVVCIQPSVPMPVLPSNGHPFLVVPSLLQPSSESTDVRVAWFGWRSLLVVLCSNLFDRAVLTDIRNILYSGRKLTIFLFFFSLRDVLFVATDSTKSFRR
jgi:hypothetical protein